MLHTCTKFFVKIRSVNIVFMKILFFFVKYYAVFFIIIVIHVLSKPTLHDLIFSSFESLLLLIFDDFRWRGRICFDIIKKFSMLNKFIEHIFIFKFVWFEMLNSIINLFQLIFFLLPLFSFVFSFFFLLFSLKFSQINMFLNLLFVINKLDFRFSDSCFFLILLDCKLIYLWSDCVIGKFNKEHFFLLINEFSLRLGSLIPWKLNSWSTNLFRLQNEFFLSFAVFESTLRLNFSRRDICISKFLERHSCRSSLFVPNLQILLSFLQILLSLLFSVSC